MRRGPHSSMRLHSAVASRCRCRNAKCAPTIGSGGWRAECSKAIGLGRRRAERTHATGEIRRRAESTHGIGRGRWRAICSKALLRAKAAPYLRRRACPKGGESPPAHDIRSGGRAEHHVQPTEQVHIGGRRGWRRRGRRGWRGRAKRRSKISREAVYLFCRLLDARCRRAHLRPRCSHGSSGSWLHRRCRWGDRCV